MYVGLEKYGFVTLHRNYSHLILEHVTMEMRYKIIMIGITIDVTSQMLGNNEIVVTSCSITSSTTKKNQNTIVCNWVR